MTRSHPLLIPLALAAITFCSTTSMAEEPAPESPSTVEAADDTRFFSLTVAPSHLIIRLVEFTGEFAVTPDIGVAAILGAGSNTTRYTSGDVDSPYFEVGAQGAYYALGDFDHGMQLGAEALAMHTISDSPDGRFTTTGQRFFVGPFIGYKVIASFGLTFFFQLGMQYTFTAYQIPEGARVQVDDYAGYFILVNFNLGWSF